MSNSLPFAVLALTFIPHSSDIVFTGAVNPHLPSVEAVLAGFEEKKAKSGTVGVLIYVVRFSFSSSPFRRMQLSLLRSKLLVLIYCV